MATHRDPTAAFYEEGATAYFERTVAADLTPVYDRFLPLVRPGGRILDIGCGSGRDLAVFLQRGFKASGIDASAALARLAAEHSGAPCLCQRVETLDTTCALDGLWACASLLHLAKEVLPDVARRLYEALVPGGVLYATVQVGAGTATLSDGRFYSYFAPEEFAALFEGVGFQGLQQWESADTLPGRPTIRWTNLIARKPILDLQG